MVYISEDEFSQIYEYGKGLPPGPILLAIRYLDKIPFISERWRNIIPFGLADPPNGIFSHSVPDIQFPPLKPLSDFVPDNGGLISFITSSDTVLGDLTTPTAIVAVTILIIIIRNLKHQLVLPFFSRLGHTFASRTHGEKWCQNNNERIVKFGEYCFRLIFHSSISLFGLYYFVDKPWWDPARGGTLNLFVNHPNHPIDPGMTWYYLLQAAYNVEVLVYMLEFSIGFSLTPYPHFRWKDTVRGDFREMMVHHFAAIGLIYVSSFFRFTRIGSMVFLIHDVSDVPVDMSKLANFVKWKNTTIMCFLLMVFMWFVTRLCIYPFVVVRAMLFETQILIREWVPREYFFAHKFLVIWLSCTILLLNVTWFMMFLKMGWVLVFQGKTHDLTEHKKGESVKGDDNRIGESGGKSKRKATSKKED